MRICETMWCRGQLLFKFCSRHPIPIPEFWIFTTFSTNQMIVSNIKQKLIWLKNSWKFVIGNLWIHEVNNILFTYLDWYLSCLAIQTPGGLQMEPWKLHLKQFEEISIFPERTVWRSPCECGHKFEQLSGGKNIWNLIKCILPTYLLI